MKTTAGSPLFSPAFFQALRDKCGSQAWAQQALAKLQEQAEQRWARPFDIPLLEGGWSHNYNCPKDGDRLERLDRHHHRCPTCGSVWSGSPWDEVAVTHEHVSYSTGSRLMALLYGITGEARAAAWAKQVLLFYAAHYAQFQLHDRHGGASKLSGKVMCQTLSESSWLIPMAQAYCMLKQLDALTETEQQMIERDLLLQVLPLLDGNPMRKSNWQSYHNAARAWIAAATSRREQLEQAVRDSENGFEFQMEFSLSDDGFWYEGAWGYHFYTLEAQVQLVLAAQTMGMPLHEHERFQSMFRAPLQSMFPDGTLPPVHDSSTVNVYDYAALFEFSSCFFNVGREIVAASRRDSINALLFGEDDVCNRSRSTATASEPEFTELTKAGMIYMKQPSSSQAAMIDYGEHGGYHGHRDKLNLLYYAGGHPWLTDAGMLPYGNAMHEAYFKQTAAHNTVTIGGRSQAEAQGRMVKAERLNNGWLLLATETEEAYPGAYLRRQCVLTDRVLLDVFDVRCEQEQEVDWFVHTQGVHIHPEESVEAASELQIGTQDGYEYLKPVSEWKAGQGEVWMQAWRWDDGEHRGDHFEVYALHQQPDNTGEAVIVAESPAMPSIGKRSTLIRRRSGVKETRFITVFRACSDTDAPLQIRLRNNEAEAAPSVRAQIEVAFPDGTVQIIEV
ncbi:heparinase II/III domain-containing protein [Paenibacillus cremeus]|uniref:Alginate lyase family protein n=1 Tax=Paenibacillus cremeus TaxID=2163881 RepID=A0A559JKC1_9BACL|nr:heparinase II/III family protein [Paenibacillus cremeus]TVY00322.1 alginate lyase family protein [Paenibacillus cremeus]